MSRKLSAIVCVFALVLVGLLLAAVQYEQSRHRGVMKRQLESKTAELDRRLAQLAVVPRLLTAHPDIAAALMSVSLETADKASLALQKAQRDSNAEFAFLLNTEGTTIAASNFRDEVSFVGRNYAFRPYFSGALQQNESTFFAVGATTGIPGYFVANPVVNDYGVVGVVVIKFALADLLEAWRIAPYEWLATDEFGVVILSTVQKFLYLPTRKLDPDELAQINRQRKYLPSPDAAFEVNEERGVAAVENGMPSNRFFLQSRSASAETWKLYLLVNRNTIWFRALLYVLAVFALLVIGLLIYRIVSAQRRLAESERKYAMELELEVQQRTEELRSAQERLISESNFAMLGRMSAAINHEINQPLTSLRLNLASMRKLIAQPDADVSEIRQIVVDTDRTTKRIGRVITTLRNLTRQQRARHNDLAIKPLVIDVVETVKRERPAMSACLSVLLDENVNRLTGNEVLLQQALLNLLYNAFDAVIDIDNPAVELAVFVHNNEISMRVTDNGCGVSDSVVDNLFKPFVSDDTKKSGMGLGLTLVELIVRDHAGTLMYQPATTGSGSVFTLTLPVKYVHEGESLR